MNLAVFLQKVTNIVAYYSQSNFFGVVIVGLMSFMALFGCVRLITYIIDLRR